MAEQSVHELLYATFLRYLVFHGGLQLAAAVSNYDCCNSSSCPQFLVARIFVYAVVCVCFVTHHPQHY